MKDFAKPGGKNIGEMLSKNEIKYIQSLGHKKSRDEEGVFIAEGPKLMKEIANSDFDIIQAYALPQWMAQHKDQAHLAKEISAIELERISTLKTPHEILVIAKQKILKEEPQLKNKISLVVDQLQDPGNMGTIIRIADWFGVGQVIASENSVELYNPKVVQATMGSIFRVKVWYKDLKTFLPQVDVPVYGALLEGQSIYDTGKISEGVLIVGNEARGISEDIISMISHPVTIPKIGHAESLNVAVATGIILSHLVSDIT